MNKITEIFRTFAPEYLDRFGSAMPFNHHKALNAILSCRTQTHGLLYYECEKCGEKHILFRSCGNRHCPACQNHKTREWMARQMTRQLPGHHFMATFTVPSELRDIIRKHQKKCYSILFAASSQAMRELITKGRHVKGDHSGFFGVLHTWGRQLQYHPHVHYLVPGGAVSKTAGSWESTGERFFLPGQALSALYRGKFKALMKKAGLFHLVCPDVWNNGFNVNIKPAGNGEHCIKYLTPYIFKVAISEHRIEKVEGRVVTITYRKKGSRRIRRLHLEAMEFMHRYLQHVLPTGFMKVRYYGFMNSASGTSLSDVREMVMEELQVPDIVEPPEVKLKPPVCKSCGGSMLYICAVLSYQLSPDGYG